MVDFGGLKDLKQWLKDTFDHTCLVAEDDPEIEHFKELHSKKLIDLRVLPAVGCEKTAEYVYDWASNFVKQRFRLRCWVESVEVSEHGANSAICSKK